MLDTRIILSGLWVATMLTFLWGDVLTMFAGDVKPGEIGGMQPTQVIWVGIAGLMMIPDIEVSRDSLGKHYRSHILGCF